MTHRVSYHITESTPDNTHTLFLSIIAIWSSKFTFLDYRKWRRAANARSYRLKGRRSTEPRSTEWLLCSCVVTLLNFFFDEQTMRWWANFGGDAPRGHCIREIVRDKYSTPAIRRYWNNCGIANIHRATGPEVVMVAQVSRQLISYSWLTGSESLCPCP